MLSLHKTRILNASHTNTSRTTLTTCKKINVNTNTWEHLASDREVRGNLIAVEELDNNRVAYTELK